MNLIEKIKNNQKKTLVRVYMHEQLKEIINETYSYVYVGEWNKIKEVLKNYKTEDYVVETICVNSALELKDTKNLNARIEYGAIIRENVEIDDQAVILMGAVVNSGSKIGSKTMIDMGAVIGANAKIEECCHIGANAVIAGTIEPYSEHNVVIENNCFIGAGAVILEGVHIKEHTIVGANSVVREDLPAYCVAVGIPAKIIKQNQKDNWFVEDLR